MERYWFRNHWNGHEVTSKLFVKDIKGELDSNTTCTILSSMHRGPKVLGTKLLSELNDDVQIMYYCAASNGVELTLNAHNVV